MKVLSVSQSFYPHAGGVSYYLLWLGGRRDLSLDRRIRDTLELYEQVLSSDVPVPWKE